MLEWLKHAFAVNPTGPVQPTLSQQAAIDAVCREIIRRHMTLPAQMMLESSAPLNFVTGQLLRMVEPFLGLILDGASIRDFASFLEQRGSLEYISRRLQELQEQGK
ncbi:MULTISPECIES: hypothetical protein [unclassified Schlesneria]|uniref:hypothetical protein n=1 Tax=Schlesneria TaxID=656899 RepID=UPI0035A152A6